MTMWKPELDRSKPRYAALADSIAEDIRSRKLKPGDRLPTHRDLADALGVTVGTVSRGYAEAERRGLVLGEVGRGTFVASDAGAKGLFFQVQEPTVAEWDLGLNTNLEALGPRLGPALQQLSQSDGLDELLRYSSSGGLVRHRLAGARWLREAGLQAAAEDVFVCAGVQHCLSVVLYSVLHSGDTLLTESLTYPGVKELALRLGVRLAPVAMDEQGLLPDSLEAVIRAERPRGLYLMPSAHNPTTACLPEDRRKRVVELIRRHDLLLLEDDPYARFMKEPPTPLSEFLPERSFYVSGVSKVLAGGLRVAYLKAPQEFHRAVVRGITSSMWMAPPLMAEIATRWIEDGTSAEALARKQAETAVRVALAREALSGCSFAGKDYCCFLWLRLPEPWRGDDFEREAGKRGLSVFPAERFIVGHAPLPFAARISLGRIDDRSQLRNALKMVRDMLLGSFERP
ncbi:MAG: PLP-dependent aminotransferase family protein [Desulfovibrionaceae bacterium]